MFKAMGTELTVRPLRKRWPEARSERHSSMKERMGHSAKIFSASRIAQRPFIFTFSEFRKRDREAAWKRRATGNRVCAACSAIRSRSPSLNCYSIVVFMTAFPGFNVEH
jgi:hypothetical protein